MLLADSTNLLAIWGETRTEYLVLDRQGFLMIPTVWDCLDKNSDFNFSSKREHSVVPNSSKQQSLVFGIVDMIDTDILSQLTDYTEISLVAILKIDLLI